MAYDPEKLISRLRELQFLSETNVSLVEEFAKNWSLGPYDSLTETKVLSETKLADFIAEDNEMKRLRKIPKIKSEILSFWPFEKGIKYSCLPIKQDGKNLRFALAEPCPKTLEEIKLVWPKTISLCVVEKTRILDAITFCYAYEEQENYFRKHKSH